MKPGTTRDINTKLVYVKKQKHRSPELLLKAGEWILRCAATRTDMDADEAARWAAAYLIAFVEFEDE